MEYKNEWIQYLLEKKQKKILHLQFNSSNKPAHVTTIMAFSESSLRKIKSSNTLSCSSGDVFNIVEITTIRLWANLLFQQWFHTGTCSNHSNN